MMFDVVGLWYDGGGDEVDLEARHRETGKEVVIRTAAPLAEVVLACVAAHGVAGISVPLPEGCVRPRPYSPNPGFAFR